MIRSPGRVAAAWRGTLAGAVVLSFAVSGVGLAGEPVRSEALPPLPCSRTISIEPRPAAPLIESVDGRSRLNFDFLVANMGAGPVSLHEIDLVVRDAAGAPVLVRQVDRNGSAPGLAAVEPEELVSGGRTTVFNPISDFPASLPLAQLDFTFTYRPRGGASADDLTCAVRISPSAKQPTMVGLPLRGLLLAWDGHDFLSHHRRRSLNDPEALRTGRTENSSRYAYDFSLVDRSGAMFRADGLRNEDWYGWNAPVHAVAAGKVVRVENGQPDQDMAHLVYPEAAIRANPWNEFGNSILIDHGGGVYSLLAHLRRGSVVVRVGEKVAAGEVVGRVGSSGAALTVHTHFQLQDSSGFVAEGLTVRFDRFERFRGAFPTLVRDEAVDTGEIVRSAEPK